MYEELKEYRITNSHKETFEYNLITRAAQEVRELRMMLCMAHCKGMPYLDDGEIQDNTVHPVIDYKRDTIAEIRHKWYVRRNGEFKPDPMKSAQDNQEDHTEWFRNQKRLLDVPNDGGSNE